EIQEVFGFESPQAIYKWIHGRNLPTVDNLIILAEIFNVTVDDILRVVFGRMTDEDKSLVKPEERIKLVGLNEFIVPGDMKLEDVNSVLKINLESEEYSTLGGWLLEHFDELPSTGEIFRWNGILFYIEDQAQRKIRQVRVSFGQKGR
ncbi:helix-turn-helix domain-containing protein, partial [bacterium]|nr:helix-turn-helix domain-containing protein [bacterium]